VLLCRTRGPSAVAESCDSEVVIRICRAEMAFGADYGYQTGQRTALNRCGRRMISRDRNQLLVSGDQKSWNFG